MAPQTHDHTHTCGYSVPDKNDQHFHPPQSNYRFQGINSVELNLETPNIVKDADGKPVGTWTMVYDEGFEVRANGLVYFAFNKYRPKPGTSTSSDEVRDYISECGETMIGWYHGWESDSDKWGCWQGLKKMDESSALLFSLPSPSSLLQENPPAAGDVNVNVDGNANPVAFALRTKRRITAPPSSLQPLPASASASAFTPGPAPAPAPEVAAAVVSSSQPVIVSKMDVAPADADSFFEPSEAFVQSVNNDLSSTWQAKIHDDFKNYKLKDMMRMIGWRQYHKPSTSSIPPRSSSTSFKHNRRTLSDFPAQFDWRAEDNQNFITPVRNQESCGSCYSIAAAAVAESRILIQNSKLPDNQKNNNLNVNTFKLSPQSVVSCSTYNQGCDGGYPFLVGKHGRDFGFVEESCMPYSGTDSSCSAECGDTSRYFVQNYGYIGGYYGGCSEEAMMLEIQTNGPIVVAFNAPGSLFYYNGGIFSCGNVVTESEQQAEGCHAVHKWEKTNHAVVAVGWGEQDGHKYWIIKNSWGNNWGENGYFRIDRGQDACAIESMGVHLEPILAKRTVQNPNPSSASSFVQSGL